MHRFFVMSIISGLAVFAALLMVRIDFSQLALARHRVRTHHHNYYKNNSVVFAQTPPTDTHATSTTEESFETYPAFTVAWAKKPQRLVSADVDKILQTVRPAAFQGGIIGTQGLTRLACRPLANQYTINPKACAVYMYDVGAVQAPAELGGARVFGIFYPTVVTSSTIYMASDFVVYAKNRELRPLVGSAELGFASSTNPLPYISVDHPIVHDFPEFKILPTIALPEYKGSFVSLSQGVLTFDAGVLDPVANTLRPAFTRAEFAVTSTLAGPVYFRDNVYTVPFQFNVIHQYRFVPDFQTDATTTIRWFNEKTTSTVLYAPGAPDFAFVSGDYCSAAPDGADIVDGKNNFLPRRLQQTGVAGDGRPIFEIKQASDSAFYQKFYNMVYVYNSEWPLASGLTPDITNRPPARITTEAEQMSFANFIKSHPVALWQDPFNHWHVYLRQDFMQGANDFQCGSDPNADSSDSSDSGN